ncbi:MAG: hypothetical protein E7496_11030 [Ruminococcus sp.]|nr:hypothetical protein [Ruminococcus sp.]
MKKLKLIMLVCSLLMLTACSHPEEESSVPAETSAPETAVSEMQTLPAEVVAEISASETQISETVSETDTVPAETGTVPAESSGNTETVMTETIPAEPETTAEQETSVPETLPEEEEQPVITEAEIPETSASVSLFQNTCWAGIDENRSEHGLLFGSDAVKVIRIDGNSEISEKEYQYSADAEAIYFSRDGEENITKNWTASENNQLTLTDKTSGETITFYAVDGSTEEEVIAVMDALAMMQ